jgi:hypothetical protein
MEAPVPEIMDTYRKPPPEVLDSIKISNMLK